VRNVTIGNRCISGLCIGGNPFSGFSHQNDERSQEMRQYYTPERIRQDLAAAEQAGINTFFGRTDEHILGVVDAYWQEGGTIQWFAQVSPDRQDPESWRRWLKASIDLGAAGAYIHGGVVDFWYANGMFERFAEALCLMREGGVVAGFAGHNPRVHEWIRDNLDVDFQMCSHYNPTDRSKSPHHIAVGEKWDQQDRAAMLEVIATIEKPVVHYKVFAAGNRPIIPAFQLLAKVMRQNDVICAGMFTKDDPDMIAENVSLFERHVDKL